MDLRCWLRCVPARSLEQERASTASQISLSSPARLTRSALPSPFPSTAHPSSQFESHYLFNLLGGTPEEVPANYEARSPINNAAHISAPLLVLQGTADRIVLPAQATGMVETIRNAGGSAEMIMFEGEAHGFRRADSKKKIGRAHV